ncbi:MAG TPA: histidine--tRNA ligase [Candidatus Paceibacterota bacterium]|jgi:histidyl-tRNA synthetase|nr:histidine--tRNA ligase [Candidatus Paceibacterota bacterium]
MFNFLKKAVSQPPADTKERKLSTESYKGVRDFFPADMTVEKHIFSIWRAVSEKYGYEEYGSSVLEPADLYRAKSGEELINEQTYTFTDRGDREVTLRPEMTPTLARMVAAKKRELIFPLRWYSIPNLFRYEQPQRGRVREHWQLNVDLFGVESITAEIEVINMAYDITRAYGLKDTDFEIRINNRKVMNYVTKEVFSLNEESARKVSKLIDKKEKIKPETFKVGISDIFKNESKTAQFLTLLNSKNFEEFAANLPASAGEHEGVAEIRQVIAGLEKLGITNARFDQTLMRGFDYYTGIVFEVFDLNPANRRSVFGGGRYDELLALFGNEKVPAVGFGAGDVVAQDLMETYGTLPQAPASADIALCIMGEMNAPFALDLAQKLRSKGTRVAVDLSGKKLGDQIKNADRRHIPKVIVIGEEEVKTGKLKVKDLKTGEEVEMSAN